MVLRKPIVEFVSIQEDDVILTSGPAAEYCKEHGDHSMEVAQLCYTMTGGVEADWATVCGTFGAAVGQPDMNGHVEVDPGT
jgi:hypothetical protein